MVCAALSGRLNNNVGSWRRMSAHAEYSPCI